ncbi:amidase family protein [Jiangella mangrovi]|uniref:Asp-tRNA(Asn)/Glu-tRNA(Gln) amidotransferase A subunit family amidase n=1 Tax=Jiangella mangrovi TaxID=1524084 RepID=A0A7W9GM26_9ACTN|nr:amidase family protein [Jiangella mangrovi]MBB5786377.1 Asp-tRNA(Asn)/Glu-tRNA(Gln) amidotransferase A subunit family amidase [Jiangella mangrovi]
MLSLAVAAVLAAPVLAAAPSSPPVSAAPPPPVLDLETLDGLTAEQMMESGELTSVQLVQAYLERIEALNKSGPGLNAVTQINPAVMAEARRADELRADGVVLGPAHGLPVLLKDLIDVKGMYTSNGNYSLRHSYPEDDAGIVKKLRESGVIILGKVGLSEWANSFGSQPSGFGNLTGQVLNANDADQNPSGSSSGTGAAGAAALSMLTVGTETSGSIISPSGAQSLVGIRPTVGIVPAYGIGPISSSQDTAGPMDRTVANAAMHLQSMVGRDPKNEAGYAAVFGPNWQASIKRAPEEAPDYMSALDLDFVRGQRIGYNGTIEPGSPTALAFDALVAAGAIMVERPSIPVGDVPALPSGYQQHKAIDEYYRGLGASAPINSLEEEVAVNAAESDQALKFGNQNHANAAAAETEPGGPNETAYRAAMPIRRAAQWAAIDSMMNNQTPDDPSDDFLAILGSVPSGATAGTPQITIPMGYSTTHRRAVNVSIHGNAYSERNLIGVAYVIEQATRLRQPVSELNPSMYRCADTVPAPAFASRGGCNPSYSTAMELAGSVPRLPFSLETETAQSLQARQAAGTLTAETLTRAYLARIAASNAEGPAIQAVRALNVDAVAEAKALDKERKKSGPRGPLHGIPVLLDDSFDVAGLPTTAGSIALQSLLPADDAAVVAQLRAAGAIILGKTNVTELNGVFDANLPEGYSSLGGQVLLPSDTDKTPAGSSAGSAAATSAGLAALTIGMETGTDVGAQLIAPAGVAGVVGLKPGVGVVDGDGVLPVASSQDAIGPLTRSVYDAAVTLGAVDSSSVDYTAGLTQTALAGKKVAVVSGGSAPYPAAVATVEGLGATVGSVTLGAPTTRPSIVLREFSRDLDAYLGGASSLDEIIAYNQANPVEGLKYQQNELLAASAATLETYESDLSVGRAESAAVIDSVLASGYDVIMVPSNSTLVGIADRAGYPVLTVPAGEGTGNAGRNPIGVTFVGTAGSEASLLAAGYAFEQGHSYGRRAPGVTNPSMWRCTPGGSFFTGELCNPGDSGEALAELVDGLGPGRSWASIVANIQDAKSDDRQAAACSLIDALVANVGRSGRGVPAATGSSITAEASRVAAVTGCAPPRT